MSDIRDLRVTSGSWRIHPLIFGALTIAVADATAAAFEAISQRHFDELFAFTIWTLPLAIFVAWFARRRRFARWRLAVRAVLTTIAALSSGIAYTSAIYFASGGYVLAFDYPVLYCWTIASTIGVLSAMVMQQSFSTLWAFGGFVVALMALGSTYWFK